MNLNRATRRVCAFIGILSFAWVFAAQGQAETKPKPKAKAAPSKPKAAEAESSKVPPKAESGSATIKLLSPGKNPLQELRYHPEAGTQQHLKMAMKMTMATSMGPGQEMKVDVPEITITMTAKVTEKDDKGNFKQEMTMTDAQIAAGEGQAQMMAQSMKGALAQLIGQKITSKLDPTGKVLEMSKVELDAAAAQSGMDVAEMARNVSVGFPNEPVGVGAKWKTVQSVKQGVMTIEVETVNELLSVKGDELSIKTTVNGNAPQQVMSLPNAPPTAKAELLALKMTGTGTVRINLSGSAIMAGGNKVDTKTKMKITQGDQATEMSQNMTMNMTISEGSAPAAVPVPAK